MKRGSKRGSKNGVLGVSRGPPNPQNLTFDVKMSKSDMSDFQFLANFWPKNGSKKWSKNDPFFGQKWGQKWANFWTLFLAFLTYTPVDGSDLVVQEMAQEVVKKWVQKMAKKWVIFWPKNGSKNGQKLSQFLTKTGKTQIF